MSGQFLVKSSVNWCREKIESVLLPRKNNIPMPSVGMRRSTRVFGARVLRSGRRLWSGPGDGKYMKNTNEDEWIELLKNSGDGGGVPRKERGRHGSDAAPKQDVTAMDVDEKAVESSPAKVVHEGVVADNHVGRRWGVVYTRRRKKVDSTLVESSVNGNKKRKIDDKRFGKQFYRKQWRKKTGQTVAEAGDSNVGLVAPEQSLENARCHSLGVVFDSSSSSCYLVTCFLNSVLRYMRRARVGLQQLSAFVNSKTIAPVYYSCGIRFFQVILYSLLYHLSVT